MFAYDYPILGLFWTILIFSLWFAWLLLLFHVLVDIFRSDMRGLSKGIWAIAVIVAPFLGVFVYVIANGDKMTERNVALAKENERAYASYVRSAVGTNSSAEELAKLSELHNNGVLTEAEFAAQKAKVLAG